MPPYTRVQDSTFTTRTLTASPGNHIVAGDSAVAVEHNVGVVFLPDTKGLAINKFYEVFCPFSTGVRVVSHQGAAIGTIPAYKSAVVSFLSTGGWAMFVR